jgi:hypothetical protein|tara:strand:+ start:297 stop:503 length:207 start_codon:yes stop_codon:yes gene_type:complete
VEIIVLTDDIFRLIPVKELMKDIVLVQETDLFELCEILRLKLTTYLDTPINRHVMNDGSGDFYGCIMR